MAERVNGLKVLFLIAVMATFWNISLYPVWRLAITSTNTGSGGATISSTAYLGEDPSATNGYDLNYDVPLSPPPQNPGYVRIYFPHSDFGSYNGNYLVDIRATTVVQKTWSITMAVNNPLSTSYSLSWVIPPLMPDYYQPKLLIGSSTINMRNQSSHAYTGFVSSCSVRLDLNTGLPYLLAIPPDFDFSDNQPQRLNLRRYFSVLSGNLSFAYSANSNLTQSLVTINDSLFWQVNPVHGYVGNTSVNLSATGSGGTKTVTINISRDATNTPPLYVNPPTQLSILQNQQGSLSWANQISDPDLDSWTIGFDGGEHFTVNVNQALSQATVIPAPGFKGVGNLIISLADGISTPRTYTLPVSVLPSTPRTPQNLRLELNESGTPVCRWDPVNLDTAGLPLTGLSYRVQLYTDPTMTNLNSEYITSDCQMILPAGYAHLFMRIKTINE